MRTLAVLASVALLLAAVAHAQFTVGVVGGNTIPNVPVSSLVQVVFEIQTPTSPNDNPATVTYTAVVNNPDGIVFQPALPQSFTISAANPQAVYSFGVTGNNVGTVSITFTSNSPTVGADITTPLQFNVVGRTLWRGVACGGGDCVVAVAVAVGGRVLFFSCCAFVRLRVCAFARFALLC